MPLTSDAVTCRLCKNESCAPFAALDREYFHCPTCDLVFVAESDLPTPSAERHEYLLHDNSLDDPQYLRFLDQLVDPLIARLEGRQNVSALDFGSGPVPVLAMMMQERGVDCKIYDPFFAPDESVLSRTYDILSCCEVAEHFQQPGSEFERLATLLRPGGLLGVMTQLRPPDREFARWHYRRDITHVALYSEQTLEWLSRRFRWTVESLSPRVHIFRHPQVSAIP
jgi:hypothetical protein